MTGPATVTLRVSHGPLRGREFAFTERATALCGRASDCSVRLPDDRDHRTVSRHHCLLDISPPAVRVRDFGSRNGTYVNGVKIGQRAAGQSAREAAAVRFPEHDLVDGDEIRLGTTVLRLHVTAAPPLTPAGQRAADPPAPDDPQHIARRLLDDARADADAADDRELASIRGYSLLRELGRGGMGAVFLARHDGTGELVALKVMLPKAAADARARQRFLREARLTQTLRHRNIAAVHDVGTIDGAFYFTLEYCPGGSIDRLAHRHGGALPVHAALPLVLQALDGLEHAHGRGIVHRDLSPHNILLSSADATPTAKVCDFGLAKAFDQAGLSGLTRTGTAAGKPYFMPRQQLINFKNAQPEVDTWAMAATLYWMLTAHFPRDFPAHKDPWLVVLQEDPIPIRRRDPSLPAALAEVIDEALRDRPVLGFGSAAALREALRDAAR